MNAETFNALYEVGIPVFAYPGFRPEDDPSAHRLVTRTRTKAQSVGLDRAGVVWVEDHGAYIALTHVDVVPEGEWKAAQLAAAVAEQGALPAPFGDAPVPLSAERLAEYAALDLAELMCADSAAVIDRMRRRLIGEIERLRGELAGARTMALNEAVDWFDRTAAAEPDQGYRARVMRGAANDVRRLITGRTGAVTR